MSRITIVWEYVKASSQVVESIEDSLRALDQIRFVYQGDASAQEAAIKKHRDLGFVFDWENVSEMQPTEGVTFAAAIQASQKWSIDDDLRDLATILRELLEFARTADCWPDSEVRLDAGHVANRFKMKAAELTSRIGEIEDGESKAQ